MTQSEPPVFPNLGELGCRTVPPGKKKYTTTSGEVHRIWKGYIVQVPQVVRGGLRGVFFIKCHTDLKRATVGLQNPCRPHNGVRRSDTLGKTSNSRRTGSGGVGGSPKATKNPASEYVHGRVHCVCYFD